MNKKIVLNVIGSIFILWGIAAIIDNIFKTNVGLAPVLWMSYICLILIGIGVFKRNSSLIASQVAIIGIPYILWNVDFFFQLITNSRLLGITDYFFTPGPLIGKIITIQHIFNLPLSLYSIHIIKLKKTDFYKVSIFQVTLVFIISRLLTDYEQNVNCVYRNCANFNFGLPYILEWFMAYAIMIPITSFIIKKSMHHHSLKNVV